LPKLAAEGTRFENMFVTTSREAKKTQPNRNSLPFQWLWQQRILVFGRRQPLTLAAVSLIKSSDG
jgi:hypothetical protein